MDETLKYDKRLVDRLIAKGAVTWEEYEAYLRGLPDVAQNAVNLPPRPPEEAEDPSRSRKKGKG